MNPVIVIKTYWASDPSQPGVYDHATAIDEPLPELARCLDSLDDVRGVIRTVILLVAPPAAEGAARARVNSIVRDHKDLNPLVIGSAEGRIVAGKIDALCPGMPGESVSLRGYGAIGNMGFALAALLGHDVVVFMDDDEVALTPDFLIDAVYGLGQVTRQDLPLFAKTGHFIDEGGSHLADLGKARLWERWWSKRVEFNEWMKGALSGTRICRSNYACGGCMAIRAEAFSRVAFDPWITRGEDLDYLFNLRLAGLDMWFDNEWFGKHLPPDTPDEPNRYLQDIYRWLYERAKLSYASYREELRQVTAKSLMPYPGKWISPEVEGRITRTTIARIILGPDRAANLDIFLHGRQEARAYAERNAANYLRLMSFWSTAINGIWDNAELAEAVIECSKSKASSTPHAPEAPRKSDGAQGFVSDVHRIEADYQSPISDYEVYMQQGMADGPAPAFTPAVPPIGTTPAARPVTSQPGSTGAVSTRVATDRVAEVPAAAAPLTPSPASVGNPIPRSQEAPQAAQAAEGAALAHDDTAEEVGE